MTTKTAQEILEEDEEQYTWKDHAKDFIKGVLIYFIAGYLIMNLVANTIYCDYNNQTKNMITTFAQVREDQTQDPCETVTVKCQINIKKYIKDTNIFKQEHKTCQEYKITQNYANCKGDKFCIITEKPQ